MGNVQPISVLCSAEMERSREMAAGMHIYSYFIFPSRLIWTVYKSETLLGLWKAKEVLPVFKYLSEQLTSDIQTMVV